MTITDLIGFAAAAGTTIAYIPQAVKTLKSKQTKDLSLPMYIILNIGIFLWLIYGLLQTDWPIIIANIVTLGLTLSILVLKIRNG
jgi:MtN3 and saliva related transmembrane protein